MRRALVILCLLAAACASSRKADDEPTLVPPPSPTEASTQQLQAQITALQTSLTELLDRLDVINARMAKLESATPAPGPAPARGGQAIPPARTGESPVLRSADVAESYQRALMLVGQNKPAEARAAFQQVFDADPTGHLADNALFWIGETYYAAGDYSSAMKYYQRVVKEFADENKAPDAMFKLALAYVKTGDVGMARKTLEECIRKYPYSTSAASAKLELQRIKY